MEKTSGGTVPVLSALLINKNKIYE